MAPKPMINGDPLQIYTAMRRIADLSFEFYDLNYVFGRCSRDDRRTQSVNACYNQTTGGLFLEQYYSGPGSIWTPWGKWGCWGGGTSGGGAKDPMPDFLKAIGEIELFAAEKNTAQGTIGPVYAILKVGDIVLPKPELRERASYFEYEEAHRLWDEVSKQYKKTA